MTFDDKLSLGNKKINKAYQQILMTLMHYYNWTGIIALMKRFHWLRFFKIMNSLIFTAIAKTRKCQ